VPTPLAVVATSEAVLTGQAGGTGDELIAALQAKVADSEVKVGPRKIALTIADGAAKLDAFTLPSAAGTTTVTTTVDLSSLMVDSSWLLEPKAPDIEQPDKPRKGALPSVTFLYVGPLKDAWTLQPRVTADQLERELAIRKMELDADQLERLHKADIERAQREDERRKSLETDRPSPPQGVPTPPGTTGAMPPTPAAPGAAPGPASENPLDAPIAPQASAPIESEPLPPVTPAPLSAAPIVPAAPGEAAPTVDQVPALPGAEAQIAPPQPEGTVAPTLPSAAMAGQTPPQAGVKQQRRVPRKQVPVGEQVLRALQGL
jgi:hypothetical protein